MQTTQTRQGPLISVTLNRKPTRVQYLCIADVRVDRLVHQSTTCPQHKQVNAPHVQTRSSYNQWGRVYPYDIGQRVHKKDWHSRKRDEQGKACKLTRVTRVWQPKPLRACAYERERMEKPSPQRRYRTNKGHTSQSYLKSPARIVARCQATW